jgi:hypothetical protein
MFGCDICNRTQIELKDGFWGLSFELFWFSIFGFLRQNIQYPILLDRHQDAVTLPLLL